MALLDRENGHGAEPYENPANIMLSGLLAIWGSLKVLHRFPISERIRKTRIVTEGKFLYLPH